MASLPDLHFTQSNLTKNCRHCNGKGLQLLAQRSKAEISLSSEYAQGKDNLSPGQKSYNDCWMKKLLYEQVQSLQEDGGALNVDGTMEKYQLAPKKSLSIF